MNRIFTPRRTIGAALVLVLSALVLLSVLVMCFFSNVTADFTASKHYASSASTKQLADSALQLVMAQIGRGTEGIQDPDDPASARLAWTSQPGLIRTFDQNGSPGKYYKLYSADPLICSAAEFNSATELPPAGWDARQNRALYTDLNRPILLLDNLGSITLDGSGQKYRACYPILDPTATDPKEQAADTPWIEGISIDSGPGVQSNRAPMPVKWLYVLADGTIRAPQDQGGGAVSVRGATRENPIVGRMAFWTDDETCKLNINTAAGGTFWDYPRFDTEEERKLALFQPVRKEWQRYPGHPATTSLTPVFFPSSAPNGESPEEAAQRSTLFDQIVPRVVKGGSESSTRDVAQTEASGTLVPDNDRLYSSIDELLFRAPPDGKQTGTLASPLDPNAPEESRNLRNSNPFVDRSILERARFFLTANSRAPEVNLYGQPRVSMWPVHSDLSPANPSSRFTTAYDRTIAFCSRLRKQNPETWLNYYFQRRNADSTTADYEEIPRNRDLYAYLQRLTSSSVPGFGGNFLAKYGTDRDQILTEIFDYIRSTNQSDETLGSRYVLKDTNYTDATRPLEGYDDPNNGFRQFTNPNSQGTWRNNTTYESPWPGHGQVTPIQINNTMGFGRFPTIVEASLLFICNGDPLTSSTDPVVLGSGNGNPAPPVAVRQGTGSNFRLSNTNTGWNSTRDTAYNIAQGNALAKITSTAAGAYYGLQFGQRRVQAVLLFKGFCPAMGFDILTGDVHYKITGLDQLRLTDADGVNQPLFIYAGGTPVIKTAAPANAYMSSDKIKGTGGQIAYGARFQMSGLGGIYSPRWFIVGTGPNYDYLVSQKVTVGSVPNTKTAGPTLPRPPNVTAPASMRLLGNDKRASELDPANGPRNPIKLEIWSGKDENAPNRALVQTIQLEFPTEERCPVPSLVTTSTQGNPNPGSSSHSGIAFSSYWESTVPAGRFGANNLTWGTGNLPVATPTGTLNPTFTQLDSGIMIRDEDVVRSIVPRNNDYRLIAAKSVVPASDFTAHPDYADNSVKFACCLREDGRTPFPGYNPKGSLNGLPAASYSVGRVPDVPCQIENPTEAAVIHARGDWDNGISVMEDGAYINKPDDGTSKQFSSSEIPYITSLNAPHTGPAFFSPNRKIPSSGMLGSLPTGVKSGTPFQTLLFRPQRLHPGYADPKDHLIMDLFNMPVVEPYAISEAFSTAGKVNMNYQIVPFTYIKRQTALIGVLKNERITAVPSGDGKVYKGLGPRTESYRHTLNLEETLKGFEERFSNGDVFRSASQICEINLVPDIPDVTYEKMNSTSFWDAWKLTGDNTRERPYTNIYPRLTTKSNTFTVHLQVQSLKKSPRNDPETWKEGIDQVIGEYRGSATVERYIDPSDPDIPDFVTDASAVLDNHYHFRVVNTKTFAR